MKKNKFLPLYISSDLERREKEVNDTKWRTDFRRDYSRLIHTPVFRRLQGKTQLFSGLEGDFFRNRLTHSLEVAQIAKSIALKFNNEIAYFKENPIDLDLIEFSALAHDLGHPPFGHSGEESLNDAMKNYGGFESNAQVLRILTRVEKKKINNEYFDSEGNDLRYGLNLTYRSLASIIKYDNEINYDKHFDEENIKGNKFIKTKDNKPYLIKGYYTSEKKILNEIKKNVLPNTTLKLYTIEAQIMDLADDIAYSTYDIEDALKAGFLTIMDIFAPEPKLANKILNECKLKDLNELLKITSSLLENFIELPNNIDDKEAILVSIRKMYLDSKKFSNSGDLRISFTSSLVNKFMNEVKIEIDEKNPHNSRVYFDKEVEKTVDVLKKITYNKLIQSPEFQIVSIRGKEIIKEIFHRLEKEDGRLLPLDVQEVYIKAKKNSDKKRIICDFIAGMTDRYCIEFYARLTSENPTSIFKPI